MIGRNVWELFPDTVGTLLHRKAHFAAARRTPVEFEYFCPRLDRWFEYRFYPSSEGLTVLENDITRSEEHTSELQSLMRISYAVSCLQKTMINTLQLHLVHNTTTKH